MCTFSIKTCDIVNKWSERNKLRGIGHIEAAAYSFRVHINVDSPDDYMSVAIWAKLFLYSPICLWH